jgi:hypothetical protein
MALHGLKRHQEVVTKAITQRRPTWPRILSTPRILPVENVSQPLNGRDGASNAPPLDVFTALSVARVQALLGMSKRTLYLLRADPRECFPAPFSNPASSVIVPALHSRTFKFGCDSGRRNRRCEHAPSRNLFGLSLVRSAPIRPSTLRRQRPPATRLYLRRPDKRRKRPGHRRQALTNPKSGFTLVVQSK